ncbi:uncharacterized protein LOC128993339 isoform X2 [Macrosteles quadrilineatus]|uniref:uncharacterized protein LOC128993339 isoform X2 n=1 Tax=Macrosteles quadrilineatus TaxID=74068 RepID=UPI0023E1F842|nr:uncharacterized protein LOC128993339 isoform X2 [Macrosteles quadrilineatus]
MSSLGAAAVLSVCLCLLSCTNADTQNCVDYNNDVLYKADDMEGTWYPIEIVIHRNDSKIYGVPLDTNCPAVTLTKGPKKTLVMMWNSTEGDLEYKFQQKGRGQWQSISDQKGSSNPAQQLKTSQASILTLEKDKYMIVRLCSTSIHSSVILSRQNTRSADVLSGANLQLAQLNKSPAYDRKPMCSAGALLGYSINVLLATASLILLLRI